MRGVCALVAEGRKSGDEEMEKLLVGGEVFDGGIEVVIELVAEDSGSCAEDVGAFGEKGNFWSLWFIDWVVCGMASWVVCRMVVWVEEVVEVGVGEGGEIEGGVLLEMSNENIKEGDGAVEWAGRGLDGPFSRRLEAVCAGAGACGGTGV